MKFRLNPFSQNFCRSDIYSVLLCASLLLGTGCDEQVDWLAYRGINGAGYTSNSLYPPLGLKWKLSLQDDKAKQAQAFNPPVVMGDAIYFGSNDGNFYSLDVERGYMNWIFKTRAKVNSVPYADEDRIYFGSNDGRVYAVDREKGTKLWEFQTYHTVQSLILRYEDTIIFTSDTGATYFLNPEGKEQHRIPNPVWSHHTFQVYDGVVYWAPLGRRFGAYDIASKRFLWNVDVTARYPVWYSFPAIDDERVYFASNFYMYGPSELRFYAVNRLDGSSVWDQRYEMDIGSNVKQNRDTMFMRHVYLLDYMAPALWRNRVIFTAGETVVRAFEAESGEILWERHFAYPTSSAPTVAGDRVYFGVRGDGTRLEGADKSSGRAPRLVCLSAKDGRILWDMDTEGAILNAPVVSGKRMIFGTETNKFYVLEEVF